MNGWLRLLLTIVTLFVVLPRPCFSLPVETAFSPDRGATELVVKTIDAANVSVRVAAYSFSSKPIALAILRAYKRGVGVGVVVDKSNATARYTAATFLRNEGVKVRVDYRYAIMHDKFVVVDGETVETGSFNYTGSAEKRNAENVIVLHDEAVAESYMEEFDRLWRSRRSYRRDIERAADCVYPRPGSRRFLRHLRISFHVATSSCTAFARGKLSPSIRQASCVRR
jgi:phosphatidylserine/phosphatidylglycerophosphate/cardiolipin synthase-like enzyme